MVLLRPPLRASESSFTHQARRRQLVDAAIELIAELGVDRASVVKLAAHAGVSRGVVNYHFRDARDIRDAVVAEVYRVGEQQLRDPVAASATPRDSVLTFVAGSVDFYAAFPRHVAALHAIFEAARREPGESRDDLVAHARELHEVAELLRRGQREGQLREFDADIVAALIRGVLAAALARVLSGTADIDALRRETTSAVDAMIRIGAAQ